MSVQELRFEKIIVNHDYLQIIRLFKEIANREAKEEKNSYIYTQMKLTIATHLKGGAIALFSSALTSS